MIKTDIDIRFAGNDLTQQEWNDIWEILCECNYEFVPPLSSRNSSSQADLRTGPGAAGACAADQPFAYFEELRKQQFIIAVKDSRVVGVFCKRNFLTFAKIFPQAPVGKFYVNPSNFSSKISYV